MMAVEDWIFIIGFPIVVIQTSGHRKKYDLHPKSDTPIQCKKTICNWNIQYVRKETVGLLFLKSIYRAARVPGNMKFILVL